MKNKLLVGGIIFLMLVAGALVLKSNSNAPKHLHDSAVSESRPAESSAKPTVPAYQTAVEAKSLKPTLPAGEFVGKTREAYAVAKAIPETLAQLPCYCYCDRGFGHKSLHSCFEDDHAAHCAVCVDEALLAYKLQKEQGLSPEQIRETIVAKYSSE
jgi:hypothetical protein